ncbi:MAG: hypothetical protein ACK5LO_08095 [Leucobacter sp.]
MRSVRHGKWWIAAVAALALTLSACTGGAAGVGADADPEEATDRRAELAPPGTAVAELTAGRETFSCGQTEAPIDAVEQRRPFEELDDRLQRSLVRAAADPEEDFDVREGAGWFVVEDAPDAVALMREAADEVGEDDGFAGYLPERNYELVTFAVSEGTDGTQEWALTGLMSCDLRRPLEGFGYGQVWLDPDAPIEPQSREVKLLVMERNCASGQTAEGRVEVVELAEDEEQVAVVIGVRRLEAATCPGHDPTPFVLQLEHPLGDREIIDVSFVPPREVVTMPERGSQPDA